jgi:inner membrane protein
MTAPNHIIGGFAFSGVLASFSNLNIYSKPEYLVIIFLASIFPDVDLRRSLSGKLFFAISYFLSRHFAHRTLTHSLLFNAFLIFIFYIFEKYYFHSANYTLIISFSIFSHLVLDMLTLQGVALFYPFAPHKAVLPGNPKFRIRTGDKKSELIYIGILLLICVSTFDLAKGGFWLTYNQNFATVKHTHKQNLRSKNFIKCAYNYTLENKIFTDTGFVINSNEKKLIIFNQKQQKLIRLDKENLYMQIHNATPLKTAIPKQVTEITFLEIDADSLNIMLNQIVVDCDFLCNNNFLISNDFSEKKNAKISYAFKEKVKAVKNDMQKEKREREIQEAKIKLAASYNVHLEKESKYYEAQNKISELKNLLKTDIDNYKKMKLFSEIKELQKIKRPEKYIADINLQTKIQSLKEEREKSYFTGYIKYIPTNIFQNSTIRIAKKEFP